MRRCLYLGTAGLHVVERSGSGSADDTLLPLGGSTTSPSGTQAQAGHAHPSGHPRSRAHLLALALSLPLGLCSLALLAFILLFSLRRRRSAGAASFEKGLHSPDLCVLPTPSTQSETDNSSGACVIIQRASSSRCVLSN